MIKDQSLVFHVLIYAVWTYAPLNALDIFNYHYDLFALCMQSITIVSEHVNMNKDEIVCKVYKNFKAYPPWNLKNITSANSDTAKVKCISLLILYAM